MKKISIFSTGNRSRLLAVACVLFTVFSCDDEDAKIPTPEKEMPTGTLVVSDQVVSQNTVMVSSITLDEAGWVVIHEDNGSGPVVPAIISEPKYLEAGTTENAWVMLKEDVTLEDGEKLWVMLHTDTGEEEVYEFDTNQELDTPIMDADGTIEMSAIMVSSPGVSAMDQAISGNTVTIAEVVAARNGWIVIHNDNGNGEPVLPGIVGKTWVQAGTNTDVVIELDHSVTFTAGQKLFPMLHVDSPADEEYTFPENGDAPETFNKDIIMVDFEVLAPSGTMEVIDQTISKNAIVVPSVEMSGKGWIVVHADNGDNGPVVPEIISEPMQVEAGTSSNVMVKLKDGVSVSDGDKVWVMLHTDNGTIGEYEFDGASGLDGPIMEGEGIAMKQITLSAPSITVTDQPVVNNMVTIGTVKAATDGWIVIHNSDEAGNPIIPDIIGKTWVSAGINENVMIELDDTETYTTGQKLYPMLHIDSPADEEYTFPENGDEPEVFGFEENNIIVTSFMVTE